MNLPILKDLGFLGAMISPSESSDGAIDIVFLFGAADELLSAMAASDISSSYKPVRILTTL